MKLSQIYIYPIKSLSGIRLQQSNVTIRGLENDRRFLLTKPDGTFLTQRDLPQMTLIKIRLAGTNMELWHKDQPDDLLTLPLRPTQFQGTQATEVWGDACIGSILPADVTTWFSEKLGIPCQLIYMTEDSRRPIEEKYRKDGDIVSFADGFPFLILGQASMDDLNRRLKDPVDINRFRPNLVFTDGQPFEEDQWEYFTIGSLTFRGTKPCARCQVPNINQSTAVIEKEPNRTLAKFRVFQRSQKNRILFGMNACWEKGLSEGKEGIRVGDEINLIEN